MVETGEGGMMTLLASPVRRQVVEILANLPIVPTAAEPHRRSEGLTASQLGRRIGLHLTTIRFHVDQLVAAELLISHDVKTGVGRPRRHYAVNPGRLPGPDDPRTYHLLAALLADSFLDAQAEGAPQTAEEAAARWVQRHRSEVVPDGLALDPSHTAGQFLGKIGALMDVLKVWGYSASVKTTDGGHTVELGLGQCPIRDLAVANPAVACGIHRGLIRATMNTLGEEETTIGLTPFVEADLCIARVTTHHPFATGEDRP